MRDAENEILKIVEKEARRRRQLGRTRSPRKPTEVARVGQFVSGTVAYGIPEDANEIRQVAWQLRQTLSRLAQMAAILLHWKPSGEIDNENMHFPLVSGQGLDGFVLATVGDKLLGFATEDEVRASLRAAQASLREMGPILQRFEETLPTGQDDVLLRGRGWGNG